MTKKVGLSKKDWADTSREYQPNYKSSATVYPDYRPFVPNEEPLYAPAKTRKKWEQENKERVVFRGFKKNNKEARRILGELIAILRTCEDPEVPDGR
jgi:hypothetical protein